MTQKTMIENEMQLFQMMDEVYSQYQKMFPGTFAANKGWLTIYFGYRTISEHPVTGEIYYRLAEMGLSQEDWQATPSEEYLFDHIGGAFGIGAMEAQVFDYLRDYVFSSKVIDDTRFAADEYNPYWDKAIQTVKNKITETIGENLTRISLEQDQIEVRVYQNELKLLLKGDKEWEKFRVETSLLTKEQTQKIQRTIEQQKKRIALENIF